jgi:hypothetical protein
MNKLITSLAILFCAISISMKPHPAPSFTVRLIQPDKDLMLRLEIENTGQKSLSVIMRDRLGNQEDFFMIEKNIHRAFRKYDFSIAEEGLYSLEVSDGRARVVKKFRLKWGVGLIMYTTTGE